MDLKQDTESHPLPEEFPGIFHFGFVVLYTWRDPETQKLRQELILAKYKNPFKDYEVAKEVAQKAVGQLNAYTADVVELKPRVQYTEWLC
jgi:hypothetical protein